MLAADLRPPETGGSSWSAPGRARTAGAMWWARRPPSSDNSNYLVSLRLPAFLSGVIIVFISGYSPLLIPYSDQGNLQKVIKSMGSLLKTGNVSLPNLDDGYRERKRKF